MKEFLSKYENPNESRMNFGLMNREYDEELIQYIVNSCKSLEVLKYIEFLGYEYIDDEKKIDLNDYISTRRKSKKKNTTKYMYLQDSRYAELILKFKIKCKNEMDIVRKKLLIPVADENGYYTIKGKKYFLIYQLVDASTYKTRQNLTLKSFMPVTIKRTVGKYTDTEDNTYVAPTYVIYIFKREVKILLFYFAKIGVQKTLEYFSVNHVIKFVDSERDKEKYIYFPISSKLYLEVNKYFFLKYQYVQTIAFMILDIVTNRLTFDLLESKTYWIERLGSLNPTSAYNYYEKGMNTLTFFDRMLDETTKNILKIDDSNKKSIYAVVRWMIQNFNELRKKDNLDLGNKRLRCNEYIASLLTKAFSDRANRIIALGNRITLDKVREIFKFQGDIIMQQLYKSGLLRFDDKINDMDMFSKLRFTLKGPNALGSKNEKNISIKYRGVHPSHIGRIDINVCGASDPGSSGVITPFCEMNGLHFDGSAEPQDGIFEFEKESREKFREENPDKIVIDLFQSCENIGELFTTKNKLQDVMKGMKIRHVEKESDKYYIHVNVNQDSDDI